MGRWPGGHLQWRPAAGRSHGRPAGHRDLRTGRATAAGRRIRLPGDDAKKRGGRREDFRDFERVGGGVFSMFFMGKKADGVLFDIFWVG